MRILEDFHPPSTIVGFDSFLILKKIDEVGDISEHSLYLVQ